ncbi:gluconolactonase [uncultured Sphingomonas sp.]|uniref:YncE family protein n=1 Tax=uncultured Sphingomonas sp. TaxID=158754 RepID=UPI002629EE57|nr:gluconolactonase [uncultured Sphingomonas sp.]
MRRVLALSAVLAVSISGTALAGAVVRTIPGPDGGWDYARVDPVSHRLFVARADSVTVVDLTGRAPVRSIGQIAHGHSALPIPGGRTLLVTSGKDASVRVLDGDSGAEVARMTVGANPDAALFTPDGTTAYTMNAEAGTISRIDIATHRVTATIPLKPGLEYAALATDGTLFVNNEAANDLTAVDTRTARVSGSIALPGCQAPSGLAYDPRTQRLIAACANGKAAVVDARCRTLVSLLDIGEGPDAVLLDVERRRAYIPCGKSGELDVVALDGKGGPTVTGRITTEVGARTGAIDPGDGMVYLPTGRFAPPTAGQKRGAVIPGSFHILVVRP